MIPTRGSRWPGGDIDSRGRGSLAPIICGNGSTRSGADGSTEDGAIATAYLIANRGARRTTKPPSDRGVQIRIGAGDNW